MSVSQIIENIITMLSLFAIFHVGSQYNMGYRRTLTSLLLKSTSCRIKMPKEVNAVYKSGDAIPLGSLPEFLLLVCQM